MTREQRRLGDDEISRTDGEPPYELIPLRQIQQDVEVDHLQIAAAIGLDRAAIGRRRGWQGIARGLSIDRRSILRSRHEVTDEGGLELASKSGNHDRGLQRQGGVVDEVDQHGEAEKGERERSAHANLRHEDVLLHRTNRPQNHQAVGESPDEGPQDELVAPILHEIAEEPGAELLRGLRQGHDGDREGHPADRDDRSRDGGQQRPGAITATLVQPARPGTSIPDNLGLQGRRRQRQTGGHHGQRYEKIVRPENVPQMPEAGTHPLKIGTRTGSGPGLRLR